jgi:VTC domain
MRFEGTRSAEFMPPPVATAPVPLSQANEYLSPALARRFGGPRAFEIKFLLDIARAEQVEDWAKQNLAFDPFANPERGNAYRIHTLYLDTAGMNMYRRVPGHKRHKFRIRRYGAEPFVYLERKSKTRDWVAKRRTKIAFDELPRLFESPADPRWAGFWFRRRLVFRRLQPTWRVSYDRVAHVGKGVNGTLRLTLDRHVNCAPANSWEIEELPESRPALADRVIVELKFRAAMPATFKGLLVELGLLPRQASKYRLGVAAFNPVFNGASNPRSLTGG